MEKRRRRRVSASNRRGMAGIAVVVMTLLVVLLFQSHKLEQKNISYAAQIAQLEEQIEEEEARTAEIGKMPEYTETRDYIEKVAREKFGLVYEDEILFRAAD